jgi:MerR family copper efflux transcriptional regulator
MDRIKIAELAGRTGFTTATLRYYEEIGLLTEPERSKSGYRLYTQSDVDRVRFIGRAKRLGLTLDEIRSLVGVWAGGECAATRRQLRGLVESKMDAVRMQLEDAATFLRQLEGVHDRLDNDLASGATATGCECAPELPHVDTVRIEPDAAASPR